MNLHSLISAELVYRLGWTLLHSLWIGAAVALALAAVLALMDRRSAAAGYGAAIGAMLLLIAGIGIAFAIVKAPVPPVAQNAAAASAQPIAPTGIVAPSEAILEMDRHAERQPWNGAERVRPQIEPPAQATAAGEGHWLRPALPWIAGGWAAGVLLLSLWQLGGWIAVQRLKVIGVEPVGRDVEMMARRLAERLKLGAAIRIVQSMRVETPLLIGWIRPVVLMPAAVLSGLTPRQLEAILAHELAHIRRHDYLINLLQVVAETLMFYHPAVWWISRRIRLEREQCCDDVAVGVCGDRHCYVESLAALEELRLSGAVALGARGSGESQLMVRIRRLLRPSVHVKRSRTYGISVCASAIILTALIVLGGRGVSTRVFGANERANAEAVDAAALVRKAREGELWVDRVKSLRIRAELWAMPVGDKAAPGGGRVDSASRPTTSPASKWMDVEVAFDEHRIYQGDRIVSSPAPRKESRRVWDGKRMVAHEDYDPREQYVLDKQPSTSLNELFSYFGWPRNAPHQYWWEPKEHRTGEEFYGYPEDYRLVGRETVNGIACYVLETDISYWTLYIGVADGRLYGVKDRVIPSGIYPKEQAVMFEVAKQYDREFATVEEYSQWERSLSAQQRHAVLRERFRRMKPFSVPYFTHWYSDYREVAPGCWAPMIQRWRFEPEADPSRPITYDWMEARFKEVAVNQPLPDELFKIEMKEGVQVQDYTHEPWLKYNYKKNFTPQEWQAILDDAANREWKNTLDQAEIRERERLIKEEKEAPNKAPAQPSTQPTTRPAASVEPVASDAELKAAMVRPMPQVNLLNVTLREALESFEKESGVKLAINWKAMEEIEATPDRRITVQLVAGNTASRVLDAILFKARRWLLEYQIESGRVYVGPRNRDVAAALKAIMPPGTQIDFSKGVALRDAIAFMSDILDIHIRVDWNAIHAAGINDSVPVTFTAQGVSGAQILDRILQDTGDGKLAYQIRGNILLVSTRQAIPSTQPAPRPAYRSAIEAYYAQQEAKLEEAKARTLPNMDLSNTTFKEALEKFAKESGIRVSVDWRGLKAMGISPDRPINLMFPPDVTAGRVLDAILSQAARAPGQIEHRMGGGGVVVGPPLPGIAETLKKMLPPTVTIDFSRGVSLRDALDFITDVSGIRIQVDWDAVHAAGVEADTTVVFKLQHVTSGQVLDTILQQAGGGRLGYQIRGNILFVSTKQALPATKPVDTGAPEVIDIHLGAPRGAAKPEKVIPYGSAIEFRWTIGQLQEPPGQFLLQVVPTFHGQPPDDDDRKGWVVKHIPGDVRSLAYGRRWDGADTGAKDLLPGTYSVMLVAHTKADDDARNPIAITPVNFTIAPVPATRPTTQQSPQASGVNRIRELRGRIEYDQARPDRPVVSVSLAGTKATDADLAELEDLTSLQSLALGSTAITDAGMEHLKCLTSLTALQLQYTKITDAGMKHVAELRNLRELSLTGDNITNAGLAAIEDLKGLQSLTLILTRVTDEGLSHLRGLKNLKSLYLCGDQITDAGLEHLATLASLQTLDLTATGVTDAGLEHLKPMANLRELSLRDTKVSEEGIKRLRQRMPHVKASGDALAAAVPADPPLPRAAMPATRPADALGERVTRVYDIRDILNTPDFRSNKAAKVTPEMAAARGEELIDEIKTIAHAEPWGQSSQIRLEKGQLIVNATRNAHRLVISTLDRARGTISQVSIETRFMTMDRDVWQDLGVEMKLDVPSGQKGQRGAKGALLDDYQMSLLIRAVQAKRTSSLISAPRLTVFNGQLGSILIGGDGPDNGTIRIKARPLVSEDRKSIKLALDAELSGPADAKDADGKPARQVHELHILPSIPDAQILAMVMEPELVAEIEKPDGGVEKRRQVLVAFVKTTAIFAREPEQEQKEFPLLGR